VWNKETLQINLKLKELIPPLLLNIKWEKMEAGFPKMSMFLKSTRLCHLSFNFLIKKARVSFVSSSVQP